MESKYHMTLEENLFVAKRNLIDYIWKDANLEGIAITYPDTEAIFNGMSVQGYKVSEIIAVNNLKHAWQFVLDNIEYPVDYPFLCRINKLIGGDSLILHAGYIRNVPVSIGGTTWQPEIPNEEKIKEDLLHIHTIENPTDRAVTLMLYGMRSQIFLDGNKRTSMLAANQVMISHGAGVIAVPLECQKDFTKLLVDYYESNDMAEIKKFLYDYCIDGIDFPREQQMELPKENWKERDNLDR